MNTLNAIGKQVTDLFASMTPGARIMAGLMLGVIVVSLGWIMAVSQEESSYYLLGRQLLSDEEIRRAEEAFGLAQLRDYEVVGNRIQVPLDQKDLYMKALSENDGLPRSFGSDIAAALSSTNPFEAADNIERRYQTAREREFERAIKMLPGVQDCYVSYNEKRRGFGQSPEQVCAIHVRGRQAIDFSVLKSINEAASTHFAGLQKKNISVLDLGSGNIYRPSDDPNGTDENLYLQSQKEYERKYHEQLSQVLDHYGNYKLEVNVQLDRTMYEKSEQLIFDPNSSVALESTTSRRDTENSKQPPGGRPGTNENAYSNQSVALSTPTSNSTSKETEESQRNVAGHEALVKQTVGMVPQEVTVSVGIPESYYEKVWAFRTRDDDPAPEFDDVAKAKLMEETEKNIRSAIEPIVLVGRAGDDRKPNINVYPFPDIPAAEIPAPSMAETGLAWLKESWSTLALMGLVIFSLFMMSSWVKSQGEVAVDRKFAEGFGLEVPMSIIDEADFSGDSEQPREKPGFEMSGVELKGDLSSLIKENPEAAVNVIKSWIGEAA